MIGNYWNSAWRNLMKRKRFSFINIFGLAIGMASALLILTYVTFEFSFDKMHTKYDHIYRVQSTFHEGEVLTDYWASSSFGYGSAMKENLAGIEDYTRIGSLLQPEQIVKYGELTLRENQIAYAEPSFFRLFDFELLKGDKKTCLSMPGQVVITERIASKYFKDEDPIGKIFIFTGAYDKISCEVTGVMKEMPSNSHIHYSFLISYKSLPKYMQEYWYKHEAYTYVLLDSPERKAEIEREFPVMAEKYKTDEALKNKTWGVSLIPLADIHLTPQVGYEAETKGNRSSMIALIFAAIAILAIAWINYINLTVARSMERAKEVWKETLPEISHEINIVTLTSDEKNKGLLDPYVIMKNPKDSESLAIDILTFLTGISSRDGERFPILRKAIRAVTNSEVRGLMKVIEELRVENTPLSTSIADHIESFTDYDFAHLLFSNGYVEQSISLEKQLNIIQVADLVLPDKETSFEEYTTMELLSVAMLIVISTFALDFIHTDRSIFKIVDLDEAWSFLQVAQGKTLSMKLVRAGRAMNAGVYFVTQNTDDLLDEKLKNNLGLKFAFRSTDLNEIKKTLAFFGVDPEDENNQKRLRDLENGQCLISDLYGRVGVIQFHPVFEELLHAFDTRPPVRKEV